MHGAIRRDASANQIVTPHDSSVPPYENAVEIPYLQANPNMSPVHTVREKFGNKKDKKTMPSQQ